MFLTRIGFGTQAVITGDVTQIDLARGQKSGLIEAHRCSPACAASPSPASPAPTSSATRWCRRSSMPTSATRRRPEAGRERRRRLAALTRARCSRGRRASPAVQYAQRRRPTLPTRRRAAALGARGARRATPRSRCASSASARGGALNADYRGQDYATNVLTFVYDDGDAARRRHRAVRAGAAARGAGSRARRSPPTTPTWSSTACCTCRATTTSGRRGGARWKPARPRSSLRSVPDPYAPASPADAPPEPRRVDDRPRQARQAARCSNGCPRS